MQDHHTLKDHAREARIFNSRVVFALLVIALAAAALVWRMYHLQIVDYEVYNTLSDKNRLQVRPVAPIRGLIKDRKGVLLADNRPSSRLSVVLERVDDLEQQLQVVRGVVALSDEEIEGFRERISHRPKPYDPVVLKYRLDEEDIARLAVNSHRLPGFEVQAQLVRHYPLGEAFTHVLGYVGRINKQELETIDPINYRATTHIGKLGVEKQYEDWLHGVVGYEKVETNARGRVLRVLEREPPTQGSTLQLHIDAELQQQAMTLLQGKRGSVVAIDPNTDGIIALASSPSYDPNPFVLGIDHQSYAALRDSRDIPLFNRAVRGQYPPGSTIKQFVALAALEHNIVEPETRFFDRGEYQLENDERIYRDWKREGHGWMNVHSAVVESCDTYFYDVGFRMGVDRMQAMLGQFGFGRVTVRDIAEARPGILPSRQWKRNARQLPWFPGDTINMSIGQGFMLATPLQLATATAIFANRGRWVQPSLAYLEGEPRAPMPPVQVNELAHWDHLFAAMQAVMHGPKGTARASGRNADYLMAGKTGTAQVIGIAQGEEYDEDAIAERHRDHSLFVGFAPVENPQIALAVIVENGGSGSRTAAPMGRAMFDAWLDIKARDAAQQADDAPASEAPSLGQVR